MTELGHALARLNTNPAFYREMIKSAAVLSAIFLVHADITDDQRPHLDAMTRDIVFW
jgi:hypothetical protein